MNVRDSRKRAREGRGPPILDRLLEEKVRKLGIGNKCSARELAEEETLKERGAILLSQLSRHRRRGNSCRTFESKQMDLPTIIIDDNYLS